MPGAGKGAGPVASVEMQETTGKRRGRGSSGRDGGRGRNQAQLQARAARLLSEADGDAARGGRNEGCSSEVLNTP